MQTVFKIAALAVTLVSTPSFAQSEADRVAVAKLISDQYQTFGDRQAEAYGALFTPDATFITVDGMKVDGQQEIVEANAMFFTRFVDAEKNDVTFKNVTINFLDADTAVTYSVWDGLWTHQPINNRAQSGFLTMVMKKVEGQWLIFSATNAYNWRGTPNYDLTEYEVFRAQMMARGGPPAN